MSEVKMKPMDAWCRATLEELEGRDQRRSLLPLSGAPPEGHTRIQGPEGARWISFSSNDYLGLAHDPRVMRAAQEGVERYGVGSGASRLVTGTHPAHEALETALATFKGTEAALTFATGYAAAMGFATAFLDRGSIVLLDKLCHACLIDACRLSGARMRVFRHNDTEKLRALLEWARRESPEGRVVVMTESVFSMDGDLAPVEEIVRLKEAYEAQLLIDEAHAVGVLGPGGQGWIAERGLTERVDIHMGTLGKALGVAGGYLAGSRPMVDLLVNRARSFIYSTAPPPALAEATRVALEIAASEEGDGWRAHLRHLVSRLAAGLEIDVPPAAILPWILGPERRALEAAAFLREEGFFVPAIRYPTVARGTARLRFTLSAAHAEAQIDSLTQAILAYRRRYGVSQ